MNEFVVELFVASDDDRDIMLSSLDEEEMEARALSEYYKRKIIISEQKF